MLPLKYYLSNKQAISTIEKIKQSTGKIPKANKNHPTYPTLKLFPSRVADHRSH